MNVQLWVIGACVVMLLVSALLSVFRMVVGPTAVDRAIANEVLVSTVVCVLGLYIAATRDGSTVSILISLSLVGFVSSLAVARFAAHADDAVQPRSLAPVVDGRVLLESAGGGSGEGQFSAGQGDRR
ncbi:monovalent cation/H+ antiporter complex subunit F [Dermatophilus congolensis]|uniref:monovalent cation/H+ antiporter complex subunit F n=1 Tax=Dermatophilus congolensis TaxID=1863 RepID=UPI00312CBB3A